MASFRSLVLTSTGTLSRQQDADTLIVGAGIATATGGLTINGISGVTVQGNGTSALVVNSTGTAVTVQAGATLATTSTGNINLPNNGSARFQIEASAVSANVTAANLGTLTGGTNADALHSHSGLATVSGLTTTGVTTGLFAYVSSTNTVLKTDSAALSTAKCVGANTGTSGAITCAGTISAAAFTTAGGSPAVGAYVYLAAGTDDGSTGAGKLTATAPTTGVSAIVGVCLDATNYAGSKTAVVLLQIKDPVAL